ncbi:MAG: EAL domain-containing protein [Pseudomonadota bacterium]
MTLTRELTEDDICHAFDKGQFSTFYQPQISLANQGQVVGAEAFVRLNHPELGLLIPAAFLPLVTQMNLMMELTQFVVSRVAYDWKAWNALGFNLRISINIDLSLFRDKSLGRTLSDIVKTPGMPKNRLTLEISQNNDCELIPLIYEQITRLRMKGFRLSLDDFGTTSFDLDKLSELPIEEIKIHREIISDLSHVKFAQQQVRDALDFGARFGMRITAVGIEQEEIAEWLHKQGCENGQGYLYGKAMSFSDFTQEILHNKAQWGLKKNSSRLRLLLVDDDREYATLLREALGDLYEIFVANSIHDAQLFNQENSVDLMIIEFDLPDGSGIDCFKLLQERYPANEIPNVAFLSKEDTPNNRVAAYEAGAIDFIGKPFSLTEVVAKAGRIARYAHKRKSLSDDAKQFKATAHQTMKEVANYGDILHLFKRMLHSDDEKALANELFQYMRPRDLESAIQFRSGKTLCSFDQTHTVCSPIEMNIFDLFKDKGRLHEFEDKIITNDKHVSILIKNLPDDETEKGLIRDHIAVVIEGMETKYKSILRNRILHRVFNQIQELTSELSKAIEKDHATKDEIFEKYTLELKMSFHVLDLSEDQEKHITDIVDGMIKSKEENEMDSSIVIERLENIISLLTVELNDLTDEAPSETEDNTTNDLVELF